MTPLEFRTHRICMKLSLQQMANFLGLKSSRMIRYYESGQRVIPDRVVKILELNECVNKDNKE